jgi:Ca2+-binding RTX toxin-like protein
VVYQLLMTIILPSDFFMAGGAVSGKPLGQSGNDQMSGGTGSDQLLGEGGNDALTGGADTDTANGGAGTNDTCTAETETNCESRWN